MDYSVRFKLNDRQDQVDVDVIKIDKDDLHTEHKISSTVVIENTNTMGDVFGLLEQALNDAFIEFDKK